MTGYRYSRAGRPEDYVMPHEGRVNMARAKRSDCISVSPVVRSLLSSLNDQPMTDRELARICGFNPVTVTNWRTGKTVPKITDVEAIAKVLGYKVALVPLNRPRRVADE